MKLTTILHLAMYVGCLFCFMLLAVLYPQACDASMHSTVADAAVATAVLVLTGGACYHILAAFSPTVTNLEF